MKENKKHEKAESKKFEKSESKHERKSVLPGHSASAKKPVAQRWEPKDVGTLSKWSAR